LVEILGRAAELSAIARFLDDVPRSHAVLTLEGEAGIGKTTLWAEKDMPFTVLGDLFRDVSEETWSSIAGPPAAALKGALLHAETSDRLNTPRAVGLGVLSLIQSLARSGVVLIAIDDFHWCDAASRNALQFAVRRLRDEPVGVAVSLRSPEAGIRSAALHSDSEQQARSIQVGPLTLDALDLLLRSRLAAAFSRTMLAELHSVSAGNPFFALEIGRYVLSERAEPGRISRLRLPSSVIELVLRRVKRVPSNTRRLLLLMAAMPQPSESLLVRLFTTRDEFQSVLQPALDMQLVEVMESSIQFEHPLVGSHLRGGRSRPAPAGASRNLRPAGRPGRTCSPPRAGGRGRR
jgi:hypothetical protein